MTVNATPPTNADCRRVISQLGLSSDADLDDLIAAVARMRNRPLRVRRMTVNLPANRHGVWITTDTADHLVITALATPACLLHDLAHVILDHTNTTTSTPKQVTYTPDQERAATNLADYLATAYPHFDPTP